MSDEFKLYADKLFMAYEECRADNIAHFRKIMELQKERESIKSELDRYKRAYEELSIALSAYIDDIDDSYCIAIQALESARNILNEQTEG